MNKDSDFMVLFDQVGPKLAHTAQCSICQQPFFKFERDRPTLVCNAFWDGIESKSGTQAVDDHSPTEIHYQWKMLLLSTLCDETTIPKSSPFTPIL